MKLIDVLVMISKGELKEGTKVKWGETTLIYSCNEFYPIFSKHFISFVCEDLNMEVELIEPDHFADVGKMADKIEELDVKCLSDIFIANDAFNKMVAFSTTLHKLNEVINKVNAQTTVLLTQNDKDYDEAVKSLMNN